MLQQATASLYFVVFGGIAAIAYDMVRFLRALLRISYPPCDRGRLRKLIAAHTPTENVPRLILISLFDLVYFMFLTAVAAVLLFHISFGVLRWYFVAAFMIGFALYRISLSRLIMPYLTAVSIAVRSLVGRILRILAFPAKFIHAHTVALIVRGARQRRRIGYTKAVIRSLEKTILKE